MLGLSVWSSVVEATVVVVTKIKACQRYVNLLANIHKSQLNCDTEQSLNSTIEFSEYK